MKSPPRFGGEDESGRDLVGRHSHIAYADKHLRATAARSVVQIPRYFRI